MNLNVCSSGGGGGWGGGNTPLIFFYEQHIMLWSKLSYGLNKTKQKNNEMDTI